MSELKKKKKTISDDYWCGTVFVERLNWQFACEDSCYTERSPEIFKSEMKLKSHFGLQVACTHVYARDARKRDITHEAPPPSSPMTLNNCPARAQNATS